MMRVAINGSGRIGPNSYRAYLGRKSSDVIAVNDLGDQQTMAQLPESDSELRLFGCQDNPWGYSRRLVDLVARPASSISNPRKETSTP